MKVLFDPYIYYFQQYGGISNYYTEILTRMDDNALIKDFNLLFTDNAAARKNNLSKFFFPIRKIKVSGSYRLHNAFFRLEMKQFYSKLKKGNFDIYHPSYYDENILTYLNKNAQLVLTVHDMIHEKFPTLFKNDNTSIVKKKLIERADSIIAVSENTKKDLLEIYPAISNDKIFVTYLSHSLQRKTCRNLNLQLSNKYFLYVGNREGYKNFKILLSAFCKLKEKNKLKIVCAGGGSFTENEISMIDKLNLSKNITQVGILDSQLLALYNNAIALVVTSLYEGFGIPVIEAFSSECPVICSNKGSLPEIAGNAALFFDPSNSKDLANKMNCIINNPSKSKNLVAKGIERNNLFSWKKTALETISVYKNLVHEI